MKRLKQWLAAAAALALALCCCPAAAAAELTTGISGIDFHVEQVYVNVPELDVYFYAQNGDGTSYTPTQVQAAGLELSLGKTTIPTGTIGVANDPICYIIAIDNSDSIDPEDFSSMVNAVRTLAAAKAEQDQITLYTTAGGATCVLNATTDTKLVNQTLAGLKQADGRMNLTDTATVVANQVQTDYQALAPRKVFFACTNSSEILSNLALLGSLVTDATQQMNMALYAFVASKAPQQLSVMTSLSGGKILLCEPDEMGHALLQKQEQLAGALEIKTDVPESLYGTRLETFTLAVPALGSAVQCTTTVYMGYKQEKPQVTNVMVVGRNKIRITFNQPINANATRPQFFRITSKDIWGWRVGVKSVELSDDGRTATLHTETLYAGDYAIALNKVSARMTPANVSNSNTECAFHIAVWPRNQRFYLERFRVPIVLAAALLLWLVFCWARGRYRDRLAEKDAEAEHLLGGAGEDLPALPRRYITLLIGKRGSIAASRWVGLLESSLILGSDAAQCDLCLQDKKIAAQHCVLTLNSDAVLVQTLSKENPVYVNGERIGGEHRLQNNDTLRLGKTSIQLVL